MGSRLIRNCGFGNRDGGGDYFSACCKVPPNYDLVIEGTHRAERSVSGSGHYWATDPATGVRRDWYCTAPGFPTILVTVQYRLRLKSRCVLGRVVLDFAGSEFHQRVMVARTPDGLGATWVQDSILAADEVGERAWQAVAVLVPEVDLYRGVIAHPTRFAIGNGQMMEQAQRRATDGLCSGNETLEDALPDVAPAFAGMGGACDITGEEPPSGSYTMSWDAAARCTDGHFSSNGTGQVEHRVNRDFGTAGRVVYQLHGATGTDSVTWDRNDNVVQQEECGDVPQCGEPPATGACCVLEVRGPVFGGAVNSCAQVTAEECARRGGAYRGDRTGCATVAPPCPGLGKCCLVDGTCTHTTGVLCRMRGGVYAGDGTVCVGAGGGCAPIRWACCAGGFCTDLTLAECEARNGTWLQGLLCTAELCGDTPAGSCCLGDGACVDGVTAAQCRDKQGRWAAGVCSGRVCVGREDSTLPPVGELRGGGGCVGCGVGELVGGGGGEGVEWML